MDSLTLDTAIGLVFVFAAFGVVVSVVTESISRYLGLRGEYLLRGLRSLVDSSSTFKLGLGALFRRKPGVPDTGPDPTITKILNLDYIKNSGDKGTIPANAGNARLPNKDRRKVPSYLSGRTFARAVLDLAVPNGAGETTVADIAAGVANLPPGPLRTYLATVTRTAEDDIEKIRQGLEEWYDDHMARVSGWYKRHVRWISLVIGTVLVVAFNVNAIQITQSLYTDEALRESVVTRAIAAVCDGNTPTDECLKDLPEQISAARSAGLPIGWLAGSDVKCDPSPCDWPEAHGLANPTLTGWDDFWFLLLVLMGWAIMVLTLLPGSRFWFDLLGKFGSLRSTGPKPPTAPEK
jgi:hypothetical protein